MRIQTVDTLADGVTPTPREVTNGLLISEACPNDVVVQIPKNWGVGPPFSASTTYGNFFSDLLEIFGF